MTDPTLDTIDHVLHDYQVSADAMRWTPEPVRPRKPFAPIVTPPFDPVAFAAAVNRFADAYRAAMRGFVQKLNELAPVIRRAVRLMQLADTDARVRRSAMHREYHRRQKRRTRR